MKTTIVSKAHYSLAIDLTKKRLYLQLKGSWSDQSALTDYLSYLQESINNFQDGFTMIADLSELVYCSDEVSQCVHKSAISFLRENGLKNSAQVSSPFYRTNLQLESAGLQFTAFSETDVAEIYLDANN